MWTYDRAGESSILLKGSSSLGSTSSVATADLSPHWAETVQVPAFSDVYTLAPAPPTSQPPPAPNSMLKVVAPVRSPSSSSKKVASTFSPATTVSEDSDSVAPPPAAIAKPCDTVSASNAQHNTGASLMSLNSDPSQVRFALHAFRTSRRAGARQHGGCSVTSL